MQRHTTLQRKTPLRAKKPMGHGRGMKGRTRNASEKRFHDLLCSVVGCIACRKMGEFHNYVSVHHISGRTNPNAHWLVLPLCAGHHQDLGVYGLIPVHPHKTRFEAAYGKQADLLRECIDILISGGFLVPDAALHAAGMKKECPTSVAADSGAVLIELEHEDGY